MRHATLHLWHIADIARTLRIQDVDYRGLHGNQRDCGILRYVISHHIPSYPIISHHIPSYPIISHHIPSYPIISHHIPSYPIISHHIPSYPRIPSEIGFFPSIHPALSSLLSCSAQFIWCKMCGPLSRLLSFRPGYFWRRKTCSLPGVRRWSL